MAHDRDPIHEDDDHITTRTDEVYERNEAGVRHEVVHSRFGGIDVPATLVGGLVALAMTALLGGLAGAAFGMTVFGEEGMGRADVVPAAILAAIVLCISYFVGGWAAGRIARYSGVRNGFVAALWTLLLGAAVALSAAAFGERFDIFSGAAVPQWAQGTEVVDGGAIGALAGVALMLLFGAIGGKRGETYHRRADHVLTEPRVHGV